MKRLCIKNVGPISEAEVEMNRFNFFIGPQSSGKSTIAKIFSTCSWIEKEVATTFNEKAVASPEEFISLMVDFHKMDTYFEADPEIHFQTDTIKIDLEKGTFNVQLLDKDNYRRKKICYIPPVLPHLQCGSRESQHLQCGKTTICGCGGTTALQPNGGVVGRTH